MRFRIAPSDIPSCSASLEMELNVTRVSLQLRHAILARNAQELEATLADSVQTSQNHCWCSGRAGLGMFDDEGRQAFVPCKAW